jgi:hypothetical protein
LIQSEDKEEGNSGVAKFSMPPSLSFD